MGIEKEPTEIILQPGEYVYMRIGNTLLYRPYKKNLPGHYYLVKNFEKRGIISAPLSDIDLGNFEVSKTTSELLLINIKTNTSDGQVDQTKEMLEGKGWEIKIDEE